MTNIPLTKRPLLDRARRMWALTQEAPEPQRIIHALMFVNREVPELLTELDRVQQENARLRAALAATTQALVPVAERDSFAPDLPYEYHYEHAAAVAAYQNAAALLATAEPGDG